MSDAKNARPSSGGSGSAAANATNALATSRYRATAPADDDAATVGMINPMPRRSRAAATAPPAGPHGDGDDESGKSQPNEACRLLFGANTPTAPIDAGFPTHTPFDHGEVDVRVGRDDLDLATLQTSLSAGANLAGLGLIVGSACTGIGLFYLMKKMTLVKEGEVALTQVCARDGRCASAQIRAPAFRSAFADSSPISAGPTPDALAVVRRDDAGARPGPAPNGAEATVCGGGRLHMRAGTMQVGRRSGSSFV